MRLRCSGQRRLNETLLELSVARYSRTGMATIPKLMTPFQIDRGMPHHLNEPLSPFARGYAARIVAAFVKGARAASQGVPTTQSEGAAPGWPDRHASARAPRRGRSSAARSGVPEPRRS